MITHSYLYRFRVALYLIFIITGFFLVTAVSVQAAWKKQKFKNENSVEVKETIGEGESSSKKFIKRGKKIYYERCAACHGESGIGDGQGAEISGIPPTDLTNRAYMSLLSDEDIFERIKFGEEGIPYMQMTGYQGYISEKAIWSAIAYIRTLEKDKGPLEGPTPREREEKFTDPIERGRIYYLRYCSPCHGVTGDGKGWAARTSGGKPIAHNNPIIMATYTRQEIYEHVKGLRKSKKERNMPIFGPTITPRVVKEIATFTKTLPENQTN